MSTLKELIEQHSATLSHENQYTIETTPEALLSTAKTVHKTFHGVLTSVFCVQEKGGYTLRAVFHLAATQIFIIIRCHSKLPRFPALSPAIHAATWFEREIRDLYGIELTGHLDPRPLVLFPENWPSGEYPLQKDFPANRRPPFFDATDAFTYEHVDGEGIFEIPVGPVHAGVIEPGHFRFSVAGEPIIKLEARLFWTHKGIEKLFEGRSPDSAIPLAERISGDESFSHAFAFVQSIEKICGIPVDPASDHWRGIWAEVERISMHLFDIGNICVGVAFNFGAAHLWRLKESLMREVERITGSRLLRSLLLPGGIRRIGSAEDALSLARLLGEIDHEARSIVRMIESSSSILDRLKATAPLRHDVAKDFGAVGVVARGSGVNFDARVHLPYSIYRTEAPKIAMETDGDVYSRTRVRIAELQESIRFVRELLAHLPQAEKVTRDTARKGAFQIKDGAALGWAEAPRGNAVFFTEIHEGRISRVALASPSFLNWHCMPQAISGMIVPDFPLLNKSFGLSYSGCDR